MRFVLFGLWLFILLYLALKIGDSRKTKSSKIWEWIAVIFYVLGFLLWISGILG
jgi:hypothetical protein